ncbi:MAG: sensor histidine kinase [Campylobacterales bacterium]
MGRCDDGSSKFAETYMQELELKIPPKEWIKIAFIGVVFSSSLSSLIYFSNFKQLLDGVLFGGIVGFVIATLSAFFITLLNRLILPSLPKKLWGVLAALFSFLSGFLGTYVGVFIVKSLSIEILARVETSLFFISSFLGVLTYLIGALLYQFVKTSNRQKHIENELYKSRLSSLETQLNPHFLFNALNSLAELLHSDKSRCEESIMKLSSFLREGMKEERLIPIKKELNSTQNYVDLENIRFENRIMLKKSIDKNAENQLIPKFSIQLLVENAIKHGFKNHKNEFIIEIDVKYTNRVYVVVKNSGEMREFSPGVGLKNLDERVRLLCGGRVYLQDRSPTAFCIEIKRCDESFGS